MAALMGVSFQRLGADVAQKGIRNATKRPVSFSMRAESSSNGRAHCFASRWREPDLSSWLRSPKFDPTQLIYPVEHTEAGRRRQA